MELGGASLDSTGFGAMDEIHARELGWLCGPCFPSEARLSLDTQVHQAHVRQAET